jgi:hypothetical protein
MEPNLIPFLKKKSLSCYVSTYFSQSSSFLLKPCSFNQSFVELALFLCVTVELFAFESALPLLVAVASSGNTT